jgi:hypothetical protein
VLSRKWRAGGGLPFRLCRHAGARAAVAEWSRWLSRGKCRMSLCCLRHVTSLPACFEICFECQMYSCFAAEPCVAVLSSNAAFCNRIVV